MCCTLLIKIFSFFILTTTYLPAIWASQPLTIPIGILPMALNPHFLAKGSLFIALILLGTVVIGYIAHKIMRLPHIAGHIIGGLMLGPSLLNIAAWPFFAEPLSIVDYAHHTLYTLASSDLFMFVILFVSSTLTISYLLWIAGHETNSKDMYKVGLMALTGGFFGAVLPIVSTVVVLYSIGVVDWSLIEALAIGITFSATSVSIPVAMLFAYNKMHLRSSKATLGAAIVDDIIAILFLSLFFIAVESGLLGMPSAFIQFHGSSLIIAIISMVVFALAITFFGQCIMPPFFNFLEKYNLTGLIAPCTTVIMLLYYAFAELGGGLAGITGSYFAGMFHRSAEVRHRAKKTITPFLQSVLLPLFLGSIGLQINVQLLHFFDWMLVIILLVCAVLSKLIACFASTLVQNRLSREKEKWTLLESYLFGSSMVARGEVGLIVAMVLYSAHVMTEQQYVISIVVIVLTTIVAPVMLSVGFYWLEKTGGTQAITGRVLGLFPIIGTQQMFNIIIGRLRQHHIFASELTINEDQTLAIIPKIDVRLFLSPDQGIIIQGCDEAVEGILTLIKADIKQELNQLKRLK